MLKDVVLRQIKERFSLIVIKVSGATELVELNEVKFIVKHQLE